MGLPPEEEALVERFCAHPFVQAALADPDVNVRLAASRGEYLFVGPGVEKLVGFEPHHLIHVDPWSLIDPNHEPVIREALGLLQQGHCVELIAKARTKDGSYRWICNRIQPYEHVLAAFATVAATPADNTASCRPLAPFMDAKQSDEPISNSAA